MKITSSVSNLDKTNLKTVQSKNVQFQTNPCVSFGSDSVDFNSKIQIDTSAPKLSHLSDRVNIPLKDKKCFIASLPKSLTVKNNQIVKKENATQKPCIAVIDVFLGDDKIKHGEYVSKCAISGLEDKVELLGISVDTPVANKPISIIDSLDALIEAKNNGVRIDALNLSISDERISLINDQVLKGINNYNVVSNKEKIINSLLNHDRLIFSMIGEIICKINELVKMGVDVYVSAGNKETSLFALSDAKCIAGTDPSYGGQIYPSSGFESLITDTQDGVLKFKPVFEKFKCIGARAQNGTMLSCEDFGESFLLPFTIKGSSFASPCKLNSDIKSKI